MLFALLLLLSERTATAEQVVLRLSPGPTSGTLAGNGVDGPAVAGSAVGSSLGWPRGLAFDSSGNLFVADTRNNVVVRVTPGGTLAIVAGTGGQGFSGDGGSSTAAKLNLPAAVAVDATGNLYIADTGNHRIRRVSVAGIVSTVAGTGVAGDSGDDGPATAAQTRQPRGLVIDEAGTLYIADTGNHRVRALRADGSIFAIAGSGAEGDDGDGGPAVAATLREPVALALNADGSLLIGDNSARRVRMVSTAGIIAAFGAAVRRPEGLAALAGGSVYVADAGNQVATAVSADGTSTVLGTGGQGVFSAGLPISTALDSPAGVALDANGNLVVSDRRNHQIQRMMLPRLDFGAVAVGASSAMQTVMLTNAGAVSLQVLAVSVPAEFALVPGITTCGGAVFSLAAAGQCVLGLAFVPAAQGDRSGVVQLRVSGVAPLTVLVDGTGTASGALSATVTTLSSNGTISYVGAPIGLNVAVAGVGANVPSGAVSVYDGSVLLQQATLSRGGAALMTTALTVGQHVLKATYSGDALFASSTSGPVTETLVPDPDFTLASVAASYTGSVSSAVSIGMTLTPVNGTLNRVVTFASSGLPAGTTAEFVPATVTLGGDPVAVTVQLHLPATVSSSRMPLWPLIAGGLLLGVGLRRRKMAGLLGFGFVAVMCLSGCGGFRGGPNSATTGGGTAPFTVVISATTTGVLGDTLVHSAAVGLVVSK